VPNPRSRRLPAVCTGSNLCRPSESCADLRPGSGPGSGHTFGFLLNAQPATAEPRAQVEMEPRLARSTCTGTGEPGSNPAEAPQAVPRVTSAVCGEPPSRMNVTVTEVSGA
jgi:hypothetical protein